MELYGLLRPYHICLFQIALLETLSNSLRGLSLSAEISWSVVWSHFIVAPFLEGLVDVCRGKISAKVHRMLLLAQKEGVT